VIEEEEEGGVMVEEAEEWIWVIFFLFGQNYFKS